jgi:hypothetical protein
LKTPWRLPTLGAPFTLKASMTEEQIPDETYDEAASRYIAAAHAMQTGVAQKLELDGSETTTKHLRAGVNSAMVEHAALAHLLIEKGLIDDVEYMSALADAMEREVRMYERWLTDRLGISVRLG